MNFQDFDLGTALNIFILLLIGMGPKIALVPFLDKTRHLSVEDQRIVAKKMVMIAGITALVLYVTGAFLLRLLHISTGALSVAGGLVLLLLALPMVVHPGKEAEIEEDKHGTDLHKLAVHPLAVPFLLNPVGITIVIVASAGVESVVAWLIVLVIILAVIGLDWLIFNNMDKFASRLNPTTMAVSEAVFGVLLAAVAVQLAYYGLAQLGIVEAVAHAH